MSKQLRNCVAASSSNISSSDRCTVVQALLLDRIVPIRPIRPIRPTRLPIPPHILVRAKTLEYSRVFGASDAAYILFHCFSYLE